MDMGACSYSSIDGLSRALLAHTGPCLCIERQAADDVMPAFLAQANKVADEGKPVLVVCADEAAQQRYLAQLPAFPALRPHDITTMHGLCLRIISDKRVGSAIGRSARVLDENEHDVLLEDMKVSGLQPRRLREMLKFFYKGISDCANEQEGWLLTGEEQQVFALLEANLEVRCALLACELPSKAYQGLLATGIELEAVVLLDDYGTLSKASQRLIDHISQGNLIVAGTKAPTQNADEDYPFHEGFASFIDIHPGACPLTIRSEWDKARRYSVVCDDPGAEFSFVAAEVAQRIAGGTKSSDILVAVPNSTWSRNITEALAAQGIAAVQERGSEKVKGNPRLEGRCADLKLAAFLKLYLDPTDVVALRSWLGLGDWLLRSDAFLELMAYAKERNTGIWEAIAELRAINTCERSTMLFSKLDRPLEELQELQAACLSISPSDAVALFERHTMPLHASMVAYLGDDPARADIWQLAKRAFQPKSSPGGLESGVTVASYRRCHGRHVHTLFITGLVNGFLPAPDAVDDRHSIDHRRNALARERWLFDDVEATACTEIVRSSFKQDRLENTERMDVQASRVFVKDTVRFARVTPSQFI
jgi:superfamily I DNA/RNA helicase